MSAPLKDSGVEWLKEVPTHWAVVQSRRLFTERNQKARDDDQQLTVSQKYGLLPQEEFMQLEGRRVVVVQKGHDILKRTLPGDFVISMRSFQGGLELSEHEGSVSSAYVPITPKKWVVPEYFRWVFKSITYVQALQSTSDLVRDGQALRFENFAKVPLPHVPEDEQRAIAGYLDRETTRIDALVSKKARFIELLREKRQALITHAVTKGLNPNVLTKDSGVEWLGKVPASWNIGAIRRFYSFNPSRREISTRPRSEEVSFLPMEAIGETGVLDLTRTRKIKEVETGYSYFANGDVVIAKITPCFENGKGAAVDDLIGGVGFGTTELIVLRPSPSVTQQYSWWLFAAAGFRQFAEAHMEGSAGQKRVQDNWLKAQKVAIPPHPEQEAIVTYLDHATTRIDTLIAKTERSIELLREHRAALITAAVTGKIDLRPAA